MTADSIQDILDDVAAVAAGITGMRYFAYPPGSAQPPFMFPANPVVDYDLTMARGTDRVTLEVYVGTPAAVERTAWLRAAAWADGSSIKDALEGNVGQSCRVTDVRFGTIGLAEGDFLGAVFTLDVVA